MTYVGTIKNSTQDFKTLILAETDEEAKAKVHRKFASWWGNDYRKEDVLICAFGDGHQVLPT